MYIDTVVLLSLSTLENYSVFLFLVSYVKGDLRRVTEESDTFLSVRGLNAECNFLALKGSTSHETC